MNEFEANDIDDVKYKDAMDEPYQDVHTLYINGEGIWTEGESTEITTPLYRKGETIWETESPATSTYTVGRDGVYLIYVYGGGGGAAMVGWSNSNGDFGGAAVAPGGSGACVTASAQLHSGDIISFAAGALGLSTMHSSINVNENLEIIGKNGGTSFCAIKRYIPASTYYDIKGKKHTRPAHWDTYTLAQVTGGRGGKISMQVIEGGSKSENRVLTPGAGGEIKVGQSSISGKTAYSNANNFLSYLYNSAMYHNSSRMVSESGKSGIAAETLNLTGERKNNLIAVADRVSSGYGAGAGGKVIRKPSKGNARATIAFDETNAGSNGYVAIIYWSSLPKKNKKLN